MGGKKKKKILLVCICSISILSLLGCSKKIDNKGDNSVNKPSSSDESIKQESPKKDKDIIVSYKGSSYSLPMDVNFFLNDGWKVSGSVAHTVDFSNDQYPNSLLELRLCRENAFDGVFTKEEQTRQVKIINSEKDAKIDFSINGISFDSTKEEVLQILGEKNQSGDKLRSFINIEDKEYRLEISFTSNKVSMMDLYLYE